MVSREAKISDYRGFEIYRMSDGSYQVVKGDETWFKCNTPWSCIVNIDELLSP